MTIDDTRELAERIRDAALDFIVRDPDVRTVGGPDLTDLSERLLRRVDALLREDTWIAERWPPR